jgi:pimeloyl-ACP methyl ester carboxylesterase
MNASDSPQPQPPSADQRVIVLLHGYAAARWWMVPLARHFAARGIRPINWGYASLFQPLESHATRLADDLRGLDRESRTRRIDLVTHSMGCIVARVALAKYRPAKCGRWVMMAPPHGGSYVATLFSPLVGRWSPPVRELSDRPDSYVRRLPPPDGIEFGVVEATGDWMVRSASTRVPGERDRLIVRALHSTMLWQKGVDRQVLHFLDRGRFDH